jgi:hypothetical protein
MSRPSSESNEARADLPSDHLTLPAGRSRQCPVPLIEGAPA